MKGWNKNTHLLYLLFKGLSTNHQIIPKPSFEKSTLPRTPETSHTPTYADAGIARPISQKAENRPAVLSAQAETQTNTQKRTGIPARPRSLLFYWGRRGRRPLQPRLERMQNFTHALTSPAIFSCRRPQQPRTAPSTFFSSRPPHCPVKPRRAIPIFPNFWGFSLILYLKAIPKPPESPQSSQLYPYFLPFFCVSPPIFAPIFPAAIAAFHRVFENPAETSLDFAEFIDGVFAHFSRCRAILVSEIAENRERCIFRPHFCAENFIFERRKSPVFQRPFSRLVFSPVLPRNRTIRSGRRSPRKTLKKRFTPPFSPSIAANQTPATSPCARRLIARLRR